MKIGKRCLFEENVSLYLFPINMKLFLKITKYNSILIHQIRKMLTFSI